MARSIINEELSGDEPMTAINVTSLVDVMFCLLIMFMVSTPLMSPEDGKDVELPAARGEEITEEQFLYGVISVDKQGRAFLGTLPLSTDTEKLVEAAVEMGDIGRRAAHVKAADLLEAGTVDGAHHRHDGPVARGLVAADVDALFDIAAGETRLRLDRLDDAKAVREILLGAIADRT